MNDHEAQIPNPALAPLAFLIGRWRTVGAHPLIPGVTVHGEATFAWAEGGAFLAMHTRVDEPQIPSGIAYIGSDDAVGSFHMLYFDERGVSRKYDVTIDGLTVSWSRESPTFSQRFTITGAPDGRSMRGEGAMSRDGKPWEPDLAMTYTRVD